MEAKELRFDNWLIYTPTGEYVQMNIAYFNNLIDCDTNFEPIPLTPEILEKAGFSFDSGLWSMPYGNKCSIDLQVWHDQSIHFVCNSGDTDTEIKYLHHLQNLIHDFTSEELKIEL